jgi:hypothetical protein
MTLNLTTTLQVHLFVRPNGWLNAKKWIAKTITTGVDYFKATTKICVEILRQTLKSSS